MGAQNALDIWWIGGILVGRSLHPLCDGGGLVVGGQGGSASDGRRVATSRWRLREGEWGHNVLSVIIAYIV